MLNEVMLSSGRMFNIHRCRSEGPLNAEEIEYCRVNEIELAYDPIQIGWITRTCEDDISPAEVGRSWPELENVSPAGLRDRAHWANLTEKYRLRPWAISDVPLFVSLLNNPRVWELLPEDYPAPLTADLARDLINLANTGKHHLVRAIELDRTVVGQVRLLFEAPGTEDTDAEISYWLGEQYWGRGVASDVVSLFTYRCFQDFSDLKSIFGRVHEHNRGSARVLEKSRYGFESKFSNSPAWIIYRTYRGQY